MERVKYDGKLTESLIQAVVEAENRQNGLMTESDVRETPESPTGLLGGKATILSEVETSRLAELADYQARVHPTPAERAQAWGRNHRDYAPESIGGFDPDEDTE